MKKWGLFRNCSQRFRRKKNNPNNPQITTGLLLHKGEQKLILSYYWQTMSAITISQNSEAKKMKFKNIFLLFMGLSSVTWANNKEIVRGFYETAFVKKQPKEAMKKYVGNRYVQHNPFVKDGPEPFISYFTQFYKDNPSATSEVKRIVAEGDLVVVHAHSRSNPNDLGYAAIDIFLLEKGKIVEHWDAVQKVPAQSANSNTMF